MVRHAACWHGVEGNRSRNCSSWLPQIGGHGQTNIKVENAFAEGEVQLKP